MGTSRFRNGTLNGIRYGRSFVWRCLSCDQAISDRGLIAGPADNELGHADARELGPLAAPGHPRLEKRERLTDRDFRQHGHRPADFVEGGGTRKIAGHRAQQDALAQQA